MAFDDQLATDDTLEMTNQQVGFPELEQFAHDDQAIAGNDRFAESDFVKPSEPDHRITQELVFVRTVATDLCDCFEHHHPWHQGHARHVSSDPEFIMRHVFVPNTGNIFWVFVDNRRQLLHLEALRVLLPDLMNIRDRFIKIDRVEIDDEFLARH